MRDAYILLADDHILVAEGLLKLLRSEFRKVFMVHDGQDLLSSVKSDPPDLAIIDIGLPLCNGLDALREIRKTTPTVRVIMLTMHQEPELIREAFLAGASGYILKESASAELLNAADSVLMGGTYVSPNVKILKLDQLVAEQVPEQFSPLQIQLTPRQKIVLQLLVEGKTNQEMADALNLSTKTIEFHKTRILKAVGVKNTAELTQYALRHHLAIL